MAGNRGHRTVARAALAVAATMLIAGSCGDGAPLAVPATTPPTTPAPPTPPTTAATPTTSITAATPTTTATPDPTATPTADAPLDDMTSTTAPPLTTIDEPVTVTEPADRITESAVVTWIGGSDVVLEDRSLPAAVERRVDSIGGRPLLMVADTMIAPLVTDIVERVEAAAGAGADGLIVAVNPSWVHWDGTSCDDLNSNYERYACLMTPVSAEVTAANAERLSALIDAIVATGLPAYLYTIPHSADALADPSVGPLVAAVESDLAALAPAQGHIELIGVFNRGLPGMEEGDGFINIVHPSITGVERLADWLAADLQRFWTEVAL